MNKKDNWICLDVKFQNGFWKLKSFPDDFGKKQLSMYVHT